MKLNAWRFWLGLVLVIAFAGVSSEANAQTKREARGRNLTKAQVKVIIERVENRVDNFVEHFDKSLDRSRLDGTAREDWLNKRAKDLERATDELRREFDRRDAWSENRAEVRSCLDVATDIDKNLRTNRYGAATESNWARVRFELNTLADVYNLPRIGSRSY